MQSIINYFKYRIHFSRLFFWVLFISLINGGFIYLFHTTKEKNYEIFTLKDTLLAHDIINISKNIILSQTDKKEITPQFFQSKIRQNLLKMPEKMELFLIDPQMSNFNHGIVFYQINNELNSPQSELKVSFTNIPKNQCPKFAESLFRNVNSIEINGTKIYDVKNITFNTQQIIQSCHTPFNFISFSFSLHNSQKKFL